MLEQLLLHRVKHTPFCDALYRLNCLPFNLGGQH
jgi:hypothetical protein